MHAIWSGSLSFGLINIPVKVYSASEERGLDLDMLDKTTHKPIAYIRVIRGTSKEIAYENIVRGFEHRPGHYVVLEDEDFKKASPAKTRMIEIVSFADAEQIDSKYYEKPYYLEPDEKSSKAYSLLREALKKSRKVAVARFVFREREHIGAIKTEDNVLILNQLRYDEDIRDTQGLSIPGKEQLKPRELDMALQLVEQLTEPFKPAQFKDTYTGELMKMIKAKAKGGKVTSKVAEPRGVSENADDLLAILHESLRSKRGGRSSASTTATTTRKKSTGPAPKRKTTASKVSKTKSTPTAAARSKAKPPSARSKTTTTARKATGTARKAAATPRKKSTTARKARAS